MSDNEKPMVRVQALGCDFPCCSFEAEVKGHCPNGGVAYWNSFGKLACDCCLKSVRPLNDTARKRLAELGCKLVRE